MSIFQILFSSQKKKNTSYFIHIELILLEEIVDYNERSVYIYAYRYILDHSYRTFFSHASPPVTIPSRQVQNIKLLLHVLHLATWLRVVCMLYSLGPFNLFFRLSFGSQPKPRFILEMNLKCEEIQNSLYSFFLK